MNIYDFFELIYCINLTSRRDRARKMKREFIKIGINQKAKLISATLDARSPSRGCAFSHISCIKKAQKLGAKNVLILEDDIEFIEPPFTETVKAALGQLQNYPNWDILFLSCLLTSPSYLIEPNLIKVAGAYTPHAYCVNSKMFDKIINMGNDFKNGHTFYDIKLNDEIIQDPNYEVYCMYPYIVDHGPGFSDIAGKKVDPRAHIRKFYDANIRIDRYGITNSKKQD